LPLLKFQPSYFYICRELQASSAHFIICRTKSSTQFFLHS